MYISLVEVKKKDWDFILKLRNKKEFRKNFYNQEHITKKEHYRYLKKQEKNPNFFNWLIYYEKSRVGYIRILDNDISIIIDKKYHGKGIGNIALKLLENEARKRDVKKLVGKVMINNKSSKKIFTKNGYKLLMFWLEKDISW